MRARDRLRAWMADEGLTQAQAADRLGVTQGAVSQLVNGTTDTPSLEMACAIERETTRWKAGPIKPREWTKAA